MGAKRVIWHAGLGRHLRQKAPKCIEVRDEVCLSEEALRMDFLLLRRLLVAIEDDKGQTLSKLWPLLALYTILEYKSPGRPYRSGNLDRLWAYASLYYADNQAEVQSRDNICGVLAVPHRTPSLDADVKAMGLKWTDLGDGYHRVRGGLFALYVIELDIVGAAEHDDLVYALGTGKIRGTAARRFFAELIGSKEAGMSVQEMEGFDEVTRELMEIVSLLPPDMRLAGLDPEQVLNHFDPQQRLAGLEPQQRLAGLDHDHQALALPLDVLRLLPDQYFRTLSPEVQAILRKRLA